MGLFDQLAGQVMGSLGAQQQDSVSQGALLTSVMGMIDRAGGLPAILQQLKDSGLSEHVASWIGNGENQTVSGNQMADALGGENIQQVARESGIEPQHVSAGLAQLLPQIINQLTPNGQLPEDGLLGQGLQLLKARLFG